MKGLFIPEITTEMFRNGCLESIEALMAEGEIQDIDYQQPCEDCISRQALKRKLQEHHDFFVHAYNGFSNMPQHVKSRVDEINNCIAMVVNEPSVTPKEKTDWIPVSERVPEDTYPVNITWVNHAPVPYYATIKDKPFTATGCYCDGKWYWYSVTCQDYLDEYRYCDVDSMEEEIEVIAWMPLPEPYVPEINDGNMAESEVRDDTDK